MINQKRKLKRKKLIENLMNNLIKEINLKHPVKLRVNHNSSIFNSSGRVLFYVDQSNQMTNIRIILNMRSIENKLLYGFNNDYYNTRKNRLNFVIHNKKLTLRFVLLHELAHLYLRGLKPSLNTEFNADTFAIFYLNKLGLIHKGDKKCIN